MSDGERHRNCLNITLDDSYTEILSQSNIFEVVIGTSNSDSMAGESSNSGSEGAISTYTIGIDKTVEHVMRMVPEFNGGINEKFKLFINACELVLVANQNIMLKKILTKLKGQAYEVIKYEKISNWYMLKALLKKYI